MELTAVSLKDRGDANAVSLEMFVYLVPLKTMTLPGLLHCLLSLSSKVQFNHVIHHFDRM